MVARYIPSQQSSNLRQITRLSHTTIPGCHTLTTPIGDRYLHEIWPCKYAEDGIAVYVGPPPTSQCRPAQAPVIKQSMLSTYSERSGSSPLPKSLVTAVDYPSSLHRANSLPHPPITVSQSPWDPQVRLPPVRFNSTQSRDPDTQLQPASPYSLSLHLDSELHDTWRGSSDTLVPPPSTSMPLSPDILGRSATGRESQIMRRITSRSAASPSFHPRDRLAALPDNLLPGSETSSSSSNPEVNGRRSTSTGEIVLPPGSTPNFSLKSKLSRLRSYIDDRTKLTKTKTRFTQCFMDPVKSLYKRGISRASHRGSRSKSRATPSEFMDRSSEEFNETDGGSNEISEGANRLGELPEPTNEDSCQAAPGCRSNWASTMCHEISSCTGSKFTPEEHAAAEKNELLRQMCI